MTERTHTPCHLAPGPAYGPLPTHLPLKSTPSLCCTSAAILLDPPRLCCLQYAVFAVPFPQRWLHFLNILLKPFKKMQLLLPCFVTSAAFICPARATPNSAPTRWLLKWLHRQVSCPLSEILKEVGWSARHSVLWLVPPLLAPPQRPQSLLGFCEGSGETACSPCY